MVNKYKRLTDKPGTKIKGEYINNVILYNFIYTHVLRYKVITAGRKYCF